MERDWFSYIDLKPHAIQNKAGSYRCQRSQLELFASYSFILRLFRLSKGRNGNFHMCVVCVCLSTGVYKFLCPCMFVWMPEVSSEILSLLLYTYVLFYSLSLNLELNDSNRLAGQQTHGIWYICMCSFPVCVEITDASRTCSVNSLSTESPPHCSCYQSF